jgi:hypothetical protein
MALWPLGRHRDALVFRREGGLPPPDHEVLTLRADGSFQLWRTIARASRPPSPVGRFGGRLDDAQWSGLARLIDTCRRAPAVELSLPPDAAREKVVLGKRISTWADDKLPPAPFDSLAGELRALLGTLTASPEAAITVEPGPAGPDGARLVHLGWGGLELDLSRARVRAVRWEGGVPGQEWSAEVGGPRSVTAAPGWTYPLPVTTAPDGAAGPANPLNQISIHVDEVLAFDGEFWRACAVQTSPPAGAGDPQASTNC